MSVYTLQDLELTYASPFGSARDVVNQAGMVASNILKGDEAVCPRKSYYSARQIKSY